MYYELRFVLFLEVLTPKPSILDFALKGFQPETLGPKLALDLALRGLYRKR